MPIVQFMPIIIARYYSFILIPLNDRKRPFNLPESLGLYSPVRSPFFSPVVSRPFFSSVFQPLWKWVSQWSVYLPKWFQLSSSRRTSLATWCHRHCSAIMWMYLCFRISKTFLPQDWYYDWPFTLRV